MKLIGYSRVSGHSQQENTSLDTQEERIRGYAAAAGHELIRVVRETESASGRRKRAVFERVLKEVRNGEADGIIVARLDRFARNTLEGLLTLRDLREQGKAFVALDINLDTSTPIGNCLLTMLLGFAELERETINLRIRSGRSKTRENNGYIGGRPPYGWMRGRTDGKKTLLPHPVEQDVKALMMRLRESGWSYGRILAELDRRGIKPRSGEWSKGQVHNVINGARGKGRLLEWIKSKDTPQDTNAVGNEHL